MSHLCEGLSSTLRVLNLSGSILGTEGTRHLGNGRLCTIKPCVKLAGYLNCYLKVQGLGKILKYFLS